MIPTPGRIVEYTLSDIDAEQINRRRIDARKHMTRSDDGVVLHAGNDVRRDDTYPMMITRVWGNVEGSSVNGQVFLDGNDVQWVTSVVEGDGQRTFREFKRV